MQLDLQAVCAERGWDEIVIKPCVAAGSFGAKRFTMAHIEQAQAHLDDLIAERDAMVQPFLKAVEHEWERSLVYFGGEYSHAVRRPPFGRGVVGGQSNELAYQATQEEIDLAHSIIRTLPECPVYARVDLIPADGSYLLMELELIEPALFLRFSPDQGQRFADLLVRKLEK